MSASKKDLAVGHERVARQGEAVPKTSFSLTPTTLHEALQLAEIMAKSDLVPKDFQGKPGNVLLAVQMGLELGLSPMQALRTIAVINGRATMWGDGLLAIVQSSANYEWHDESESSDVAGVCIIKRKGHEAYRVEFTVEDAKRAELLGKAGPWTQYQPRMLQLRARGFAIRDKFADALYGLIQAEEALDIVDITPPGQPETQPPEKRKTLKDRLEDKAREGDAPKVEAKQDIPTETPAPSSTQSAVVDCVDAIRAATNTADATTLYKDAASSGKFTDIELNEMQTVMRERVNELMPLGRKVK